MLFLIKVSYAALFLFLLSACSTLNKQAPAVKIDKTSKLELDKQVAPLCKYSTRKGVAELIAFREQAYLFVFFPGNVEFLIEQSELPIQPNKGNEFKAIYEELIDGSGDCSKPTPQLVKLPH